MINPSKMICAFVPQNGYISVEPSAIGHKVVIIGPGNHNLASMQNYRYYFNIAIIDRFPNINQTSNVVEYQYSNYIGNRDYAVMRTGGGNITGLGTAKPSWSSAYGCAHASRTTGTTYNQGMILKDTYMVGYIVD